MTLSILPKYLHLMTVLPQDKTYLLTCKLLSFNRVLNVSYQFYVSRQSLVDSVYSKFVLNI